MAAIMGAIAFQSGLACNARASFVFQAGCSPAPLLLGVVLGPMFEENLRRALLVSRGDPPERVRELNRRLGIKPRLRDWGVTEEILPALADKAIQDGCHQLNPRPCTREDLLHLYKEAL